MNNNLSFLQSFNPIGTSPELLERTLIGRKNLTDTLYDLVVESTNTGNKFQRIIIGPRGSGKTHLFKVLHTRLTNNQELKEKLLIAYLNEDEYGVATFLDWLIRIIRSIIKWYPEEGSYLSQEIEKLKIIPVSEQENSAKKILLDYIGNRTLLVLVENLENIFSSTKGFGLSGQAKFRDLLQQKTVFTIIASNQSLFEDIQKEDRPFHNFFKITPLKKLSFDEAILLLTEMAKWDDCIELIKFLETPEGIGRMRAIYDLIGGNHRLLVTFYQFLKIDFIYDLSRIFIKTINDLIPYYQSMMDLLSAQQQKVIQYLCQVRVPKNVKSIAENCFSTQNTISKQLHNLERLYYVEAHHKFIGKETFYELMEPLLRICNEVKENHSGPIKLFIDFLGNLYTAKEIKKKFLKFYILSGIKDFSGSTMIAQEHPYYEEALKKYYPDDFKTLNLDEFKAYDSDKKIKYYISELEKNKDHSDIITFLEQVPHKSKYLVMKEALSYKELGKIDKEIEIVTKIVNENPEDVETLILLGNAYYSKEEFNQSILIYDKILALDNNNIRALILKGMALEQENHLEESEIIFKKTIEINPDFSFGWRLLGESQLKQNKFDEAKVSLLKTFELDPTKEAVFDLGLLMFSIKNYEESEKYVAKLVEIKPNNPDYWNLLGATQFLLNKKDKAELSFHKAYDLDNHNKFALENLGNVQLDKNNFQNAEHYFLKLVEFYPDSSKSWELLANSQAKLKKYEDAQKYFIKAFEFDNTNVVAIGSLGVIHSFKNEHLDALKFFKLASELKPKHSISWQFLGESQLKLNKLMDAKKSYLRAVELDENNFEAFLGLLDVFLQSGKNEIAIEKANTFMQTHKSETANLNAIGEIFRNSKLYIEAIPFYLTVLENEEVNLLTFQNLTLCYLGLNQLESAVKYFEKSFNTEINNEDIESFILGTEEYLKILLDDSNEDVMKQFLDYTISTLEKKNMKGLFYKAIPSVIFNLLKKYESISLIRFELILNLLKENFQYASEMEIPIKYLEIGIQHLVKKEKNALLKLTKEERDTFNKFVLNDAITI